MPAQVAVVLKTVGLQNSCVQILCSPPPAKLLAYFRRLDSVAGPTPPPPLPAHFFLR